MKRLRIASYLAGGILLLILAALAFIPRPASGTGTVEEILRTAITGRVDGDEVYQRGLGVSAATYPGCRPGAIILAPGDDWRAALAATPLIAAPVDGIILLLPTAGITAPLAREIDRLDPRGIPGDGGTRVLVIGEVSRDTREQLRKRQFRYRHIRGETPEQVAAAVDRYLTALRGSETDTVSLVPSHDPSSAAAAADWAAHTGTPVLFARPDSLPEATTRALRQKRSEIRIRLFFLSGDLGEDVEEELAAYGRVDKLAAADPFELAVSSARQNDASGPGQKPVGWGITSAGYGFTFALAGHPLDAVLAANLSARGAHGPLLPLARERIPDCVADYLDTLRPADPAVFGTRANRGWVVGSLSDINFSLQRRIEGLLRSREARER